MKNEFSKDLVFPEDVMEEAPDEISNIDGVIPSETEQLLKDGKHWTQHCGWDHWGAVWFADGKFHERVMVYKIDREIISSESLQDLIDQVNSKYGEK